MSDFEETNPDVLAADSPLIGEVVPSDRVVVYHATDLEDAKVVCATLEAAGIPTALENPDPGPASGMLPHLGISWMHDVYVSASNVEAARAILNAPPPTEEELIAEEEADMMTLEEAEARVKHA